MGDLDGGAHGDRGGAGVEDVLCGGVAGVPVLRGTREEGLDAFDADFPGGVETFAVGVEVREVAEGGRKMAREGDGSVKGVGEKRG